MSLSEAQIYYILRSNAKLMKTVEKRDMGLQNSDAILMDCAAAIRQHLNTECEKMRDTLQETIHVLHGIKTRANIGMNHAENHYMTRNRFEWIIHKARKTIRDIHEVLAS